MFRDGGYVFSVNHGWVKVINNNSGGECPVKCEISEGYYVYRTIDGKIRPDFPIPDVFESPEAVAECFKNNAPPKPKRKVKKTVEGFVRKSIGHGDTAMIFDTDLDNLMDMMPNGIKSYPATLTYEIEE